METSFDFEADTPNRFIHAVSVVVNISHTFRGDLRIFLITPSNETITLRDSFGGGDDFVFEELIYTPENTPLLRGLIGDSVVGRWTLRIEDHASQDVGTLHEWQLTFVVGSEETLPFPGFQGDLTGMVEEAQGRNNAIEATPMTTGTARINCTATFTTQSGTDGNFGIFTIDADGTWTYTLDNENPATEALWGGRGSTNPSATEIFPITASCTDSDGNTISSGTGNIVITVNGGNDAPQFESILPAEQVSGTTRDFRVAFSDQDISAGDQLRLLGMVSISDRGVTSISSTPMRVDAAANPTVWTFPYTAPTVTTNSEVTMMFPQAADVEGATSRSGVSRQITILPPLAFATGIEDQVYVGGLTILDLVLPEADGGVGDKTYTLTRPGGARLPSWLNFNPETRTISGTAPDLVQAAETYTYTVSDSDTPPNTDQLIFDITVVADTAPSFGDASIAAQEYILGLTENLELELPVATGGNGAMLSDLGLTLEEQVVITVTGVNDPPTVSITSPLPSFPDVNSSTRVDLVGNAIDPETRESDLEYQWSTVPPGEGTFSSSRSETTTWTAPEVRTGTEVTLMLAVTDESSAVGIAMVKVRVVADLSFSIPSFTPRSDYVQRAQITPLKLPRASGGVFPLMYTLEPMVPGLVLEPAEVADETTVPTLSGMPAVAGDFTMIYRVTDVTGLVAVLYFDLSVATDEPRFVVDDVPDQIWPMGFISELRLPAATGGNGNLTYSLTSVPESFLSDNPLSSDPVFQAREGEQFLSGVPTTAEVVALTYRVSDSGGQEDIIEFNLGVNDDQFPTFLQNTFGGENSAFIGAAIALELQAGRFSPPVELVTGGGFARNPSARSYELVSEPPDILQPGNLRYIPPANPRLDSPRIAGTFQPPGIYLLTLRMTDTRASLSVTHAFIYTVTPDGNPRFGPGNPDELRLLQNFPGFQVLPAAVRNRVLETGTTAPMEYSLEPEAEVSELGLTLNPITRQLSGAPPEVTTAHVTYRVTDGINSDERSFDIVVFENLVPEFVKPDASIPNLVFIENMGDITPVTLPEASGGNSMPRAYGVNDGLTYSLEPELPAGLTFNPETRELSGTPGMESVTQGPVTHTYIAADEDIDMRLQDAATLTFTLEVAPVIRGDLRGEVIENESQNAIFGKLILSGRMAANNPFPGSPSGSLSFTGKYGSFSLTSEGSWTYSLNNEDSDTDVLTTGDTEFENFLVQAVNPNIPPATVTITVIGANDAATFSGGLTAEVGEDDGRLSGTVAVTDVDGEDRVERTSETGTYGTFAIEAGGAWTYVLGVAAQSLRADTSMKESFQITAADDGAEPATATVTITVIGANDAASFSGDLTAEVGEDDGRSSGTVTVTDVDGEDRVERTSETGTYGTFTIEAGGAWTYVLGANAQSLRAGESRTDRFRITAADDGAEPATAEVVITVIGANDAAAFSGGLTAEVGEDDGRSSGTVTVTDVDGEDRVERTSETGTYGTFAIEASGAWTYVLGANAQSLRAGESGTDRFRITAADDGAEPATAEVVITVIGANDVASFSGGLTAEVGEDDGRSSGTVTVTDVDGEDRVERTSETGTYGTFTIEASGAWTYVLGVAAQSLRANTSMKESFQIVAADDGAEPETAEVVITVVGANDTPTVVIDVPMAVPIGRAVAVSGTGMDVDAGDVLSYAWSVVSSEGQESEGGFEEVSTTTTTWMSPETTGTVTLRLRVMDMAGAMATAQVQVEVTERARVIGNLSGTVTEDDPEQNTATGVLSGINLGSASVSFELGQPEDGVGIYGELTLTNEGVWTYTLNDNDDDTNALVARSSVTDTFMVRTVGESVTAVVVITVVGTNDAAAFSGGLTAEVGEDDGRLSGTVTVTDVDGEDRVERTNETGTYGTFAIEAGGAWTYVLGVVAQSLRAGESRMDRFRITAADDGNDPATAEVVITVVGTNDAAAFSGGLTAEVGEDDGRSSGTVAVTDVDGEDRVERTSEVGTYGTFAIEASGAWTYVLGVVAQSLRADTSMKESFQITAADDGAEPATATVTITVIGANDVAAFSGGLTAEVGEDDGRSSGTVTVTDVDGEDRVERTSETGTYGTFAIEASGAWTYVLGANAQSLRAGERRTDRFRITAADDGAEPATATVTITVIGANDVAAFSGGLTAEVGEDDGRSSGTVTVTDMDGEDRVERTSETGTYGTFAIEASGAWTYVLGANAQSLRAGERRTDRFRITAADDGAEPATATVTITVIGANDAPTASISAPSLVISNAEVNLSGSGSDPETDEDDLRYQWSTVPSDLGAFGMSTAASTTWTAPRVTTNTEVTLALTVTDANSAVGTAMERVTVRAEEVTVSFDRAALELVRGEEATVAVRLSEALALGSTARVES